MMVKSVVLPLSPLEAFELFTQRIGEWWPQDRRHTGDPESGIHLLRSGRFYERARDGQEVDLGSVRVWEAPSRLLLDFFIATGPDRPTEVEITFAAQGSGTRVTVAHRAKPASEDLWGERAPRYEQSWNGVLAALSKAAGSM